MDGGCHRPLSYDTKPSRDKHWPSACSHGSMIWIQRILFSKPTQGTQGYLMPILNRKGAISMSFKCNYFYNHVPASLTKCQTPLKSLKKEAFDNANLYTSPQNSRSMDSQQNGRQCSRWRMPRPMLLAKKSRLHKQEAFLKERVSCIDRP